MENLKKLKNQKKKKECKNIEKIIMKTSLINIPYQIIEIITSYLFYNNGNEVPWKNELLNLRKNEKLKEYGNNMMNKYFGIFAELFTVEKRYNLRQIKGKNTNKKNIRGNKDKIKPLIFQMFKTIEDENEKIIDFYFYYEHNDIFNKRKSN